MIRKIFGALSIFAILFGTLGAYPLTATAAQFTGVKDTMSTQATSATATHTLNWTLVGGDTIATAETFIIDYVNADFTLNAAGSWQTADFALSDGTRSSQAPVAVGAAPSCSAGVNNYTVAVDATNNTFTITTCASWTASGANANVTFVINGTTASGTGTMTNKSADVSSSLFSITESNGDTASGAVVVEDNSVVAITATVAPTLTFSNSDAAIGFGTLSSGAERYATADAAGLSSDTAAHTMTIGTNATTGYTLTYNGATLTNGGNTITALTAGITDDANGTPGTSQFGLSVAVTGTGIAEPGYDNSGTADWKFVASTTSTVASATGPVASDSVDAHYLANITAAQAAGAYSTNLTYIVTGNF
ncbi:MAG: hypothetical protein KBB91_00875 [Candidatus Pacebacteria bacterium]|jgi:hypothetical protein|nr:hypothetical protein [Candidatus Paceibacterota bacterium]MBP9701038.1 hypothetical protein [Candidatus Paceibacterota bacterium]